MLFSVTFVYLLKRNKRQTTDQPKYLTMANTKALTRGLYSLRSEQVSDLMQNVGFRFTTEAPTNFVVA
jgi:hypothetical protein